MSITTAHGAIWGQSEVGILVHSQRAWGGSVAISVVSFPLKREGVCRSVKTCHISRSV